MTDEQRDEIRNIQDKIIAILDRRQVSDNARLSVNMPATITLGEIRNLIFDKYISEMRELLAYLTGEG